MIASEKLTSCHCKPKHSEIRRPCASGQESQSAFRLSQVTQYCVRLCRGENHCFVTAGGLATDKAHRVRLLVSRDEPVSLAMPVHQRHDAAHSVERWICKILFLLQSFQPLFNFQRPGTKCDSVTPSWEQSVPEDSLVSFNCRVCLWVDGFRVLA